MNQIGRFVIAKGQARTDMTIGGGIGPICFVSLVEFKDLFHPGFGFRKNIRASNQISEKRIEHSVFMILALHGNSALGSQRIDDFVQVSRRGPFGQGPGRHHAGRFITPGSPQKFR